MSKCENGGDTPSEEGSLKENLVIKKVFYFVVNDLN
jgi:hypothetical protein